MPRNAVTAIVFGGLILFVALGIRQGFGLFQNPMSAEYGWGREVFSLAIGIQNFFWGLAQPFAGAIAERYGPTRVMMAGAVVFAAGLLLTAFADAEWMLHAGLGVMVGLALSAVSFAVILGAVGKAAPEEKRSMALGVASAIGSVGQFAMVPGTGLLIADIGWSSTMLLLAAGPLVMLPLALAFIGRGAEGASAGLDLAAPKQSIRAALAEAGRHKGYWLLIAGFFVCGFHVTFILTHLPSAVVDSGLGIEMGAVAISVIALFNIFGSYMAGVLGGRYRKKYVLATLYLARSAVIAAFIAVPMTDTSVILFSAGIGLLWLSTVPLTNGLVAEIFGTRHMAMLFGIVFFSHQVGALLGVWLGGLFFDLTGSYDMVWLLAIALGLFAAVVHWPIADAPVRRPTRELA